MATETSTNRGSMNVPAKQNLPQSAAMVKKMFAEVGIKEYEPQLVLQMCDLAHSLTKQILVEARSLSEFAGKKQIEKSDVDFAIKSFQEKYKPSRPPKLFLKELAAQKNAEPLPPIRQNYGLRLPNDRFCQLQPNFAFVVPPQQQSLQQPGPSFSQPTAIHSQTFANSQSANASSAPALGFSAETVSNLLVSSQTGSQGTDRTIVDDQDEMDTNYD
ncbi:transcription initiation factor IID, 31kD subunit domain-containing protein [Ditylenchus destructor]|uniref:Transcription initiation factor IID, 31kD subunit domain-containing protein n=1 Tax=Ditylenchus destructor TaxID=166010 RepID=A0AAD4N6A6_9BILA|nr:transcription initiation factor IID, 31kD subunit domain-containing protein [Ditylenchus destructor]